MPATTPRWGLQYAVGSDLAASIDDTMAQLAADLDDVAKDDQGTLALRPTSTAGSPGKAGRYYFATDDTSGGPDGTLYRDTGTSWVQIRGYVPDAAVTTGKLADEAVTATKIEAQQAWQALALSGGSWSGTPDLKFYEDSLGLVHLRGGMTSSGTQSWPSGALLIGTLPAGYRPGQTTYLSIFHNDVVTWYVSVDPSGLIRNVGSWSLTAAKALNFSMASPFRAEN